MPRILAASALAGALLAAPAQSRDLGQFTAVNPGVKACIQALKNQNGQSCCDTADGYPPEAAWKMDGEHGRYQVQIDGKIYDVPPEALIKGKNCVGYAMVWYWREGGEPQGKPQIRCFAPGSGG